MPMTSRDRELTLLNHEVPDRVPIIIGISNATNIKMNTCQKIKEFINHRSRERQAPPILLALRAPFIRGFYFAKIYLKEIRNE